MRYWIFIDNRAEGPLTPEGLGKLAVFTPDSLVCHENAKGGTDWTPAKNLPELEPVLRSLPKRFWIVDAKRVPRGPFELSQLRRVAGLSASTLACPAEARNSEDWKPAGQFAELKPLFDSESNPVEPPPPVETPSPEPAKPYVSQTAPLDQEILAAQPATAQPTEETMPGATALARMRRLRLPAAALVLAIIGTGAFAARNLLRKRQNLRNAPAPASESVQPPAPQGSNLQSVIDLVKDYPLVDAGARHFPTNLYHIGESGQRRWKSLRTLGDLFRYKSFFVAWQLTQDLARSQDASGEDLARQIRAKIQDWRGLDETYRTDWSATARGNSRYRVEVKVTDALSPRLREEFGGAPAVAAANPIEVHAFMVDLGANTVEPLNPAAQADLGAPTNAPATASSPRAKGRKVRIKNARHKPAAASQQPEASAPPASASGEEAKPSPVPVSEPSQQASPAAKMPSAEPTAPPAEDQASPPTRRIRHYQSTPATESTQAASAARTSQPVRSSPAAATTQPSQTSQPSKTQSNAPPSDNKESQSKPATEMSVEELEQYLERK